MEKVDKVIQRLKDRNAPQGDEELLELSEDEISLTAFPRLPLPATESTEILASEPMSCWRQIRTFVICVAFFNVISTTLEMYIVAILTTIERRYGFSSSRSGFLLSIKEIFILLSAAVVTHCAKNMHRPRFLAVAGILTAVGGFLSVLPYPIYGTPQDTSNLMSNISNANDAHLCVSHSSLNVTNLDESCISDFTEAHYNKGAYVFFALTAAVIGLSTSAQYALTSTYVDDNSPSGRTSLYLGLVQGVRPLGPVLSFLIGGAFLNLYENLSDPGFSKDDDRFIGAWWMGYVVLPVLLLLFALCLMCFPHRMPKAKTKAANPVQFHPDTGIKHNAIKDFGLSVWRLVRNPAYVCQTIAGCFSAFVISGMFPFLPKYMETAFRVYSSTANYLTGFGGAMMVALGMIVGGALTSRFHLKVHQMATVVVVCNGLFVCAIIMGLFVSCEQHDDLHILKNHTCSALCDCAEDVYDPVCGPDLVTYVSPCHAGCSSTAPNQTFADCLCFPDSVAQTGECPEQYCSQVVPYILLIGAGGFIGFMAGIPGITIVLRIVDQSDRALGMALQSTITSLSSFIPGPVVFGSLIDSTCLVWQTSCGERGACALYDNHDFRYKLHAATAVFKCVAVFFYFVMFVILWKRRYYYEEEVVVFESKTRESVTIYNIDAT